MIQKHGLFLNETAGRYEIVGLRKVRRDYVPTDEVEPLPFVTKGNLIVFGIDQREALPVPDEFDGVIQKITALDISRLRKENTTREPKKWEPLLQEFVERQTRYVRELEASAFNFADKSLSAQLMVQKRPTLMYDDEAFVKGQIVYPILSDEVDEATLVVDMQARKLRYFEVKKGVARQVDVDIPVGIFGRLQHVKWPKPTASAQKRVSAFHAANA